MLSTLQRSLVVGSIVLVALGGAEPAMGYSSYNANIPNGGVNSPTSVAITVTTPNHTRSIW